MTPDPTYSVRLQPINADLTVTAGTPLRDVLFDQGVEFPCGGNGRCRGCKVRVLSGDVPVNAAQTEHLRPQELAAGWRLACQCKVQDNLVIELRQWDATILANDAVFEFTPSEGLGVAIDVGTTTVVAQLLDLATGQVLGVKTALNPQARHGGDVMSRIQFAVAEGGHATLVQAIRHEIGRLIHLLFGASGAETSRLRRVALVGNTVMHHLFCDIDLEPLSHYPFEPVNDGLQTLMGGELGWDVPADTVVQFLPCLGSFVGSDILAGILATCLHESTAPAGLIDLGTNGEIVLTDGKRMLCASAAAGPAFEGARIAAGMRASTGAIWKVTARDGKLHCEVLGNVEPRGVCGSGLVDAIAALLHTGKLKATGRLTTGSASVVLAPGVELTQNDVRQVQLAKGAVAAGLRILMERLGLTDESLTTLYLAGAFGNYVDRHSARTIGLLNTPLDRIHPVGNTALLGAKIALFSPEEADGGYRQIRERMAHISLNEDPRFQDVYVEEMSFAGA